MKLAVSVVFLIFIIGCAPDRNRYQIELSKAGVNIGFTNHFPKNFEEEEFALGFVNKPSDFERIQGKIVTVYLKYKPSNFEYLVDSISSNSLAMYAFSDSCNVIPYIFQNISYENFKGQPWRYEKWVRKLESCDELRYPIPNFLEIGDGSYSHNPGISPNYDIYVLESYSGKMYGEEYYGEQIIMPEKYLRGHSRGVALNNTTGQAIYWFVLW